MLFLIASIVPACSAGGHYRTDAETFIDLAGRPPGSIESYTFLGATGRRAYLSVWWGMPRLLGGGEHIYSIEIDELPADIAGSIRAGQNPWAR